MMRVGHGLPGVLLLAMVLTLGACDKEKKSGGTGVEPPDDSDYQGSATLTTTQTGTVTTESGASLGVPRYAVPPTESGEAGTMVFSIEKEETVAPVPPAGHSTASDVYRFGPDGFTFAEMVSVTIPTQGDTTNKEFGLSRIDPTSGASEYIGGTYDRTTGKVTAQTYHLSAWYATSFTPSSTAWGAFHVTNSSTTHWLNLCIVEYALKYPTVDTNFDGYAESMWAPVGDIGWNNSGLWYLPQGTYKLCVSTSEAGTISTPPGQPQHSFVESAQLNQPWSYYAPNATDLTFGSLSGGTPGPCDCTPTPSTSVGTGDVQVTLTWHNELPIDLDLWVTEPSGAKCYWANTQTATGGRLDRDNLCHTYINGRPENIFWSDAPSGQYLVQVDFYSNCSGMTETQAFDVRVVAGGVVKTYSGTVTNDNTVDVATFTIAAAPLPLGTSSNAWAGTDLSQSHLEFGDYLGTPVVTRERAVKP